MKLFPFRKIEFLSQQVDKWPQTAVVEKKRQLPWCAAELPDEGPIALKDSSKMSPCTHTELWEKNVLQYRNLHLCLHPSSIAFADRQSWWLPVAAVAGRLPCLDKACGKTLPSPWCPVPLWPISIAQMLADTVGDSDYWSVSSSSATTKEASLVLLPRLVPSPSHLIQHLFPLTKFSDRYLRDNLEKQSSPRLVSPSFFYSLPLNIFFGFAELNFTCSKDQSWADFAFLSSAESWSWIADFAWILQSSLRSRPPDTAQKVLMRYHKGVMSTTAWKGGWGPIPGNREVDRALSNLI